MSKPIADDFDAIRTALHRNMPAGLSFSPGREGLRRLAEVLRQKTPRFTWDFGTVYTEEECGSKGCAYGLARFLWPHDIAVEEFGQSDFTRIMAEAFGLYIEDSRALFSSDRTYGKDYSEVTPNDVADAIDRYLSGKSIAIYRK